jgi:hypothetical protein
VKLAKRPRVHTFLATSAIHMEYKLKMTPDQAPLLCIVPDALQQLDTTIPSLLLTLPFSFQNLPSISLLAHSTVTM